MKTEKYVNLTLGGQEWKPRFIHRLNQGKCTQCCMCVRVCPSKVFVRTITSKIKPLNSNACIGCTTCEKSCPEQAISCVSIEEFQ